MEQIAPRRRGRPTAGKLEERLQLRLPTDVLAALQERSRQTDVPMSRIITRLLRAELQVGD